MSLVPVTIEVELKIGLAVVMIRLYYTLFWICLLASKSILFFIENRLSKT